jgi:hypothetical protein
VLWGRFSIFYKWLTKLVEIRTKAIFLYEC